MSERITNGGFEDNWTGWTNSGFTRTSSNPHGGTWSIWSYSTPGEIEQTLLVSVVVDTVESFTIWTKPYGYFGGTPSFTLTITYTDTTSTEDNVNMGTADIWNEIDLKGYLTAGKVIETIKIWYHNSSWTGYFDDISLIGYGFSPPGILERVYEVRVGYDVNNHGTLSAVNQVEWSENNPWIKIPIPAGTTIYQKIVPLQIEGTMVCYDVTSIRTIFYETDIQSADGNQYAMDEDGDRNAIEYFHIKLIDIYGNIHTYSFQNVRIETINLGKAEEEYGGETPWTVKFYAEKVSKV